MFYEVFKKGIDFVMDYWSKVDRNNKYLRKIDSHDNFSQNKNEYSMPINNKWYISYPSSPS